jgi:hypothetical protein
MQRVSTLLLVASSLAVPMVAWADDPILTQRCRDDSLTIEVARARVEWMRNCALAVPAVVATAFDTEMMASDGVTHLWDYKELTDAKAYTGEIQGYEVNSTYVFLMYGPGGTSQSMDASNRYKWSRAAIKLRPRPMYPTFGTAPNATGGTQLWPHPTHANCNLYDVNGNVVSTFYVNAFCEASCFTPEQKILFSDGEVPILDARQAMRKDLVTLAKDATLDGLKYQTNQTYSYTEELRDSQHTLIEITTRSGGHLRVTDEHPLIQGEGILVQARTLKVGDDLIRKDGSRDPIIAVEKTQYFGKVYNIRPVTTDPVTNVLVAEGFLVGSSAFQNDELEYMNRRILYRSVPKEVIP